jgi:hypothetical protein
MRSTALMRDSENLNDTILFTIQYRKKGSDSCEYVVRPVPFLLDIEVGLDTRGALGSQIQSNKPHQALPALTRRMQLSQDILPRLLDERSNSS